MRRQGHCPEDAQDLTTLVDEGEVRVWDGVRAHGTAPLTYQWKLDGRELTPATKSLLVVSNVTLADLGCYTVAARDATGETIRQPAWLKLRRDYQHAKRRNLQQQFPAISGALRLALVLRAR